MSEFLWMNVFLLPGKYLGHIVDEYDHRLDDARIQPILDMGKPKTQNEVRSLLGMTNQFRDSIPNYAKIVYPLSSLTTSYRPV